MPTVLFTASTYSHIANFHRPYLRAFHELGWQVHVACGGEPRPIPEADLSVLLPFEKKMASPANFKAQSLLRQLMKRHRYALICTHTSLAAFFTRRAAAGLRPRPLLVNMAHGYLFDDATMPLKKAILLAAERVTAPQTDLVLTMNRWDYETAVRCRLGRRVEIIPGVGVDFSRLDGPSPADADDLRNRLGFTKSDFLLIYAAEFSARKNQAMLIRALPRLPEQVRLLLPGQGALLEDCKALAQSLGISHRVVFPGQVTEMPLWYAAADAAVSASRSEGLPFNVMEAMYRGLPVAVSQVKGHTDLVTHGLNGLLYPYGDEAAFVRRIQHLTEHPGEARAMGEAARASIAPYALKAVLPQVMEQYLSLVPETAAHSGVQKPASKSP